MTSSVVDPIAWHQSLDYARAACARVFRDGGSPADALAAFDMAGCEAASAAAVGWAKAVELIAHRLCVQNRHSGQMRQAA